MRTNYVLIDYENVQPKPEALASLKRDCFRVYVFVGASQATIKVEVVKSMQQLGCNGEYVTISGNGHNALDFHIAYYIGKIAADDQSAYFHIISKDKGFDPLIAHLKGNGIFASRSTAIHDIPVVKVLNVTNTADKIAAIVENLQQRGASKPRRVKTLSSTINALFQKTLSEAEQASLVKRLEAGGYIAITDSKVTYTLTK